MTTASQLTESRTPSTISAEGFRKAASILDTEAEVGPRTTLLHPDVCRRVIDRIDRESPRTERSDATDLVAMLLRCYPDFKAHDAKGYALALFDVFSAFPKTVGLKVCDPVSGLPSRLKFMPKVGDVTEALQAEVKRRALIKANALWHIREDERRREAKARDAEFERNRPSAEERQRQVQEALGRFREGAKSAW